MSHKISVRIASQFDTLAQQAQSSNPICFDAYKHGLPASLLKLKVPSIVILNEGKQTIFKSDYYHKASSLLAFVNDHLTS